MATKTKAKTKRNDEPRLCICGCGRETARYFAPGHDARWYGWMRKVEKGEAKPSDVLPLAVVRKLGPWADTEEGGKRPAKTYKELRP